MMQLYLLRPVKDWKPWYDSAFGFVVRANSEEEARALAQKDGGDETHDYNFRKTVPAWTDPALSTCTVLIPEDGPAEVVLRDFAAA